MCKEMTGITRMEEVLSEHINELRYAPFSASCTKFERPAKTVGGNVLAFFQISRIFFDFSYKSKTDRGKKKERSGTFHVSCRAKKTKKIRIAIM
jgi:hypothetical protein